MTEIVIDLQKIETNTLSSLKDFQRATVDRIDQLFRSGRNRILISDEVGLGKTLIARGTVAKTAILRREEGDNLVKVVYICSNQTIAAQNLSKLQISEKITREGTDTSRLSMQHLKIFMQEYDEDILSGYIQLIPLTPDTSFRMTAGTGMVRERALMFAVLRHIPQLIPYTEELEVAMKDYASSAWSWAKDEQERQVLECEKKTGGKYLHYMVEKVTDQLLNGNLLEQVIDLCVKIAENGYHRVRHTEAIGKLRMAFAQISIDLLNPDLVIMDEFQRFKYLIDSDSETETGMLAKRFFSNNGVKMLLLSATPYKLYSTLEEINENMIDEHYSEFFKVMGFLIQGEDEKNEFKEIWSNYYVKLRELSINNVTIIEAKDKAENAMYGNVCRTERISASQSADIIDDTTAKTPLSVSARDVRSYIQAQQLLKDIRTNQSFPTDYIKSCPYLLSYMRDYQLKRSVEKYFKIHPEEIRKVNKDCLWLTRSSIDHFKKIDPSNARLQLVQEHAFANKAELLLWVPPSMPYYEPAGIFKNTNHFSKILIFSSWEMVPRMIASMLSFEAERKTVGKLAAQIGKEDRTARYYPVSGKRYPAARLNFSVSEGEPKAMQLFCILYPSEFLASCFSPVDTLNRHLTLAELVKSVKDAISKKLDSILYGDVSQGHEDDRWYYLAPLFMDSRDYVQNWLNSEFLLADSEKDEDDDKAEKGRRGFATHLESLRNLYDNKELKLGKKPDDLLDVLADMAIASPAICAYRLYKRIYKQNKSVLGDAAGCQEQKTIAPSQIAKVFLNRMNTPESTAVIEVYYNKTNDDAHWKNLLSYCREGNLQAVFDEYAHILIDSNGLTHSRHKMEKLHSLILESMRARTVTYSIDTFENFRKRIEGGTSRTTTNIRSHFAAAFTKGDGNADKDSDRKKAVRNSFNSPFRPFVLATTSIGQEGLDFHYYCRKIVHWNLPSNPIDLEQREGRINRFKCLAIRQNVAERYGDIQFNKDVWTEIFEHAIEYEKTDGSSDLIPFWCLSGTTGKNMIKIERIVPMYPLSRDLSTYERLIKILSLYRLTLGQARQEELLEYILKTCDDSEALKNLFINLSPFYRQRKQHELRVIHAVDVPKPQEGNTQQGPKEDVSEDLLLAEHGIQE